MKNLRVEKGAPKFFSVPLTAILKRFGQIRNLNLPVVKDDLQHHAVGCYTAESEIKKGNRQSEAALVTAEKIAAIGSDSMGFRLSQNRNLPQPGKEYCSFSFTTVWPELHFLNIPRLPVKDTVMLSTLLIQANIMAVQKLEWQVACRRSLFTVSFSLQSSCMGSSWKLSMI